jgi:acetylornithine deacetylase/succinyl-diaminopimelate desuccinylase-like protein
MSRLRLIWGILAFFWAGSALAADLSAAKLVEPGTLTYGVAATFSPFEFTKDGKLAGFDIDMIGLLSTKLGVTTTPMNMEFKGLIVTHGGTATNIVPEYAEGLFGLRAATSRALDDLGEQLRTCAEGVALATGTRVTVERATVRYDHFRDSEVLSDRFAAHLARAGIELTAPVPGVHLGSSDIGNVSVRLPAIHPFVAVMDADGSDHTPEFAAASASERARGVMLAATEALACTAADVLHSADLREEAWARHREAAAAGR